MFIVSRPQPLDEEPFCGCKHFRRRLARPVRAEERPEAFGIDAHRVPHGFDLLGALDGACQVEFDVERNELHAQVRGLEVSDRHHVVEAVNAHTLRGQAVADVFAGALGEDLILDPRRPVLPDVACLGREDDRRVTLARQQHVCVAVDDHKAGHVGHRTLEAGVLGAADDDGVQVLFRHRVADEPVAAVDLLTAHHDCSNPFTSDQIARLSGVGTPCSRPKPTMPPLR